jgi:hypothetical protein
MLELDNYCIENKVKNWKNGCRSRNCHLKQGGIQQSIHYESDIWGNIWSEEADHEDFWGKVF